jgi:hypothetical protein
MEGNYVPDFAHVADVERLARERVGAHQAVIARVGRID